MAKNAEHGSKANISKNKGKVKIKKWSKNWSFRANNWPKIATKKKKKIFQRQIFQKAKVKFRLKNGPRIGVLVLVGQKQPKNTNKKKRKKKRKQEKGQNMKF